MNKLFYYLTINKEKVGIIDFLVLLVICLLPVPNILKLIIINIGVVLCYLIWLIDSIEWACTILKMIIWLIIAPIIISIVLIAYISIYWNRITDGLPFSILFIVFFVFVWTLAALKFEKKKIKVAMSIVNAITLTILALTFIVDFGIDARSFLDQSIISELKSSGYTFETLIKMLIQVITLPYLLGGIWGTVILDFREYKE